ncbi:MAG: MBL fold metallo-hydrolase [Nocardioidaceae bacterium]
MLGTASPYPQPDRPCSGYLVQADDAKVWLDAGPGTMANLLRHIRLEELDAVWLSHLHADHTIDLLNAYYALAFGHLPARAPVPVYAPSGLAEQLAGFFAQPNAEFLSSVLDIQVLEDGHELSVGELTLTSRTVEHGCEAYGARVVAGGRTLVYSGDCAPCPALDVLAAQADVLLCEADVDKPVEPQVHHTPEDAGQLARRAGVGRLVVTHVGPTLTPAEATARAAAAFGGPTSTAAEGDKPPVQRTA